MDHPHSNSYRPGSAGSEVEQMKRKQTSNPIDPYKLKNLCLDKGLITDLSIEMGYSKDALSSAINARRVSNQMLILLEKIHGIKYEDYKPEEPKPEPKPDPQKEEPPAPETTATTKTEAQLKTIIIQLGALNNNVMAVAELLRKIDTDIKVWECDD